MSPRHFPPTGFIAESSGEFLLQENYPFLCGQYWPPELDFFEHFSPEHTWFWRPNSMSLHSPHQYVGLGKALTPQGGYCPTTLSPPGEAWCFGVSGAGHFQVGRNAHPTRHPWPNREPQPQPPSPQRQPSPSPHP